LSPPLVQMFAKIQDDAKFGQGPVEERRSRQAS
jgi:hypothetical protein